MLRVGIAYGLMIVATVVIFLLIRSLGGALHAPEMTGAAPFGSVAGRQQVDTLLHVLMALAVVIITARLLGALFKHLGQPPVIGEVIAGILLGPSFLGLVAPGVSAYLLPPLVAPYFSVLAQVGVILYMFLVGLHLDTTILRQGTHVTIAISHASITAPFLLGAGLALWIYPRLSSSDVPFTVFALFMGVSMSVTAFPVLARILTDRGMHKSRIGGIALTCAAVDDVTAWCLLAFVSSIVYAQVSGAIYTSILSLAYISLVVLVVRPILGRFTRRVDTHGVLTQPVIAVVIVAALLSALSTEYIGIHAIFGAFLLGAVIPHNSVIARELTHRFEDLVVVLLLPAFFAYTGMRTQITLVSGAGQWAVCVVIILVACLGKFGGSAIAARLTGLPWRDAAALGILMNTRGLVELIVLNVGLDLKVLSPTLFAMLVIMAVVTTVMTSPILLRTYPRTDRPAHADRSGS
jgi:Kef-type K+ transport system membrane component KefB